MCHLNHVLALREDKDNGAKKWRGKRRTWLQKVEFEDLEPKAEESQQLGKTPESVQGRKGYEEEDSGSEKIDSSSEVMTEEEETCSTEEVKELKKLKEENAALVAENNDLKLKVNELQKMEIGAEEDVGIQSPPHIPGEPRAEEDVESQSPPPRRIPQPQVSVHKCITLDFSDEKIVKDTESLGLCSYVVESKKERKTEDISWWAEVKKAKKSKDRKKGKRINMDQ